MMLWLSVLAVFLERPLACWSAPNAAPGAALAFLTVLTNSLTLDPDDTGAILGNQMIGTNASWQDPGTATLSSPDGGTIWIGSSNLWHFYVVANTAGYANAAFLIFQATNLTLPCPGGTNPTSYAISNQADVDLYVSSDPGLTNLDPGALGAADKSLHRGGTESVLYTSASPGNYYVGVKCESQRGANYTLAAVFSDQPLAQTDGSGNQLLRGIPAPALIPGGTPAQPGGCVLFCVAPGPAQVRRVIVTNTLSDPAMKELTGTLAHAGLSVVLNNHSPSGAATNRAFIYDESGEGDVAGGQPADGPGHLADFSGQPAQGLWQLTQWSTNQPGTNQSLGIWVESQPDLTQGLTPTIPQGARRLDGIQVSPTATNLAVQLLLVSGSGPVQVQLGPADGAGTNYPGAVLTSNQPAATVVIDLASTPPLHGGLYWLKLTNSGAQDASLSVQAAMGQGSAPLPTASYSSAGPQPLTAGGVSTFSFRVTNADRIVSVEAGVRIDYPRVSDLVLRLINPQGQSVLLSENRGGGTTNGMGITLISTNFVPVSYHGGPEAVTNVFDTGQVSGVVSVGYDFLSLPDTMHVYYDGMLIWDSGLVSDTGQTNLAYGPGNSTQLTFIMNEGGNSNYNTAWNYSISYTRAQMVDLTFTENPSLTATPIKFAPLPLTNFCAAAPSNAIFYLPEQSLNQFAGQSAAGLWKLEVWDAGAEATNSPAVLQQWNLAFQLQSQNPLPISLMHDVTVTNSVGGGGMQWFAVEVPAWANFATNALLFASKPVNLFFNATQVPTGSNTGDILLLSHSSGGTQVCSASSVPPLVPGATYYLGVQNTNATPVTFGFRIDYDVAPLTLGVPLSRTLAVGTQPQVFSYAAKPAETGVAIQLLNLSGNADLLVRKGPNFPDLAGGYDYSSTFPGTNGEQIVVFSNSLPQPLSSGPWYVAVYNSDTNSVDYAVLVTDMTNAVPLITTLYNGYTEWSTTAGGVGDSDTYVYYVPAGAVRAQFEVGNLSADASLVMRRGLPLPSLSSYDLRNYTRGANGEIITLFNNSKPIALTPGLWFLSVVPMTPDPTSYSITATTWYDCGTNIALSGPSLAGDSISFSWASLVGMRYFIQGKTNLTDKDWSTVAPVLADDVTCSFSVPLPSPFHFFRVGQAVAP